ncbi:MAG: S8 family serine peptidase [Egibacteraceae bacterium]
MQAHVASRAVIGGLLVALVATALAGAPQAASLPTVPTGAAVHAQAGDTAASQASTTAPYVDVCDDAGGDPLDLRRTEIGPGDGGTLRFTAHSCAAWPDAAFDGRSLRWELSTPGNPAFAALTVSREGGALTATVTEQPDGAGTVTHSGPAQRVTAVGEQRGVRADVPVGALGDPVSFDFVLSLHSGPDTVDWLPERELGEPRLHYPEACPGLDSFTVTAAPDRYEAAVEEARSAGWQVSGEVPAIGAFRVGRAAPDAGGGLADLAGIDIVERSSVVRRSGVVPNDPRFADQWPLDDLNVPAAWRFRTGSDLRVAIVDDGVDAMRADLAGRVTEGRDTRFDRALPAGQSSDRGGHGTAVAGLLGAAGNNGVDIAGVDWAAQIVPYRVFDAAGCSDTLDVAAAIVHAADAGVGVINLSVGTLDDVPALRDAVRYAFDRRAVLVAAVGNSGNATPLYPAAYLEVIGVGATVRGGSHAGYSSTGDQVAVVAPGGQSTGAADTDLLTLGERSTLRSRAGTSFAAPLVAGAALLYRSIDPDSSASTVAAAFAASAEDRGPPGRDPAYGHGLLDVHRLLVAAGVNRACPPGRVPAAPFADVGDGNVHAGAIDCVVWWSIAQGVTASEYAPRASVNRAQMATFIARTVERANGTTLPVTRDRFPDDNGNHHETNINKLAEAGIVQGGRDGRYGPNEPVTRAQMATFVVRAYEHIVAAPLPADPTDFTDVAGNTHEQAILKAFAAGLVRGQSATSYGPRPAVRRDQMGSFLGNLLGALARDGHASPPA